VRTVGVAAGVVAGAALLRKAANTAAKVVTIKAVAGAASEVAGAVRNKSGAPSARGSRRASAARPRRRTQPSRTRGSRAIPWNRPGCRNAGKECGARSQ
jgi:hypothetical protein